jgi:hypothetical protein
MVVVGACQELLCLMQADLASQGAVLLDRAAVAQLAAAHEAAQAAGLQQQVDAALAVAAAYSTAGGAAANVANGHSPLTLRRLTGALNAPGSPPLHLRHAGSPPGAAAGVLETARKQRELAASIVATAAGLLRRPTAGGR